MDAFFPRKPSSITSMPPMVHKVPPGKFKPMPGSGAAVRFQLTPRRALDGGGQSVNLRVQILVNQVTHECSDVQRAALQEVSLLAMSSQACRLALLSAKADRALIRSSC